MQFVRIENTKKEHTQITRKKIWRKSKIKRVSSSNIYIVVFAFLFQLAPNLLVEVTWDFFVFFHSKNFPSLLCSTLSSFTLWSRNKSSHRRCSIEKVLKIFATFKWNYLCCRAVEKHEGREAPPSPLSGGKNIFHAKS